MTKTVLISASETGIWYGVIGAFLLNIGVLAETNIMLAALREKVSVGERYMVPHMKLFIYVILPMLLGVTLMAVGLQESGGSDTEMAMLVTGVLVISFAHFLFEYAEYFRQRHRGTGRVMEFYVTAALLYAGFVAMLFVYVEKRAADECEPYRAMVRFAGYTLGFSELLLQVTRYRMHWTYRLAAWPLAALVCVCWTVLGVTNAAECV